MSFFCINKTFKKGGGVHFTSSPSTSINKKDIPRLHLMCEKYQNNHIISLANSL